MPARPFTTHALTPPPRIPPNFPTEDAEAAEQQALAEFALMSETKQLREKMKLKQLKRQKEDARAAEEVRKVDRADCSGAQTRRIRPRNN